MDFTCWNITCLKRRKGIIVWVKGSEKDFFPWYNPFPSFLFFLFSFQINFLYLFCFWFKWQFHKFSLRYTPFQFFFAVNIFQSQFSFDERNTLWDIWAILDKIKVNRWNEMFKQFFTVQKILDARHRSDIRSTSDKLRKFIDSFLLDSIIVKHKESLKPLILF